MLKAVLFDLDGTLVKTESLKSLAYFQAIQAVSPEQTRPPAATVWSARKARNPLASPKIEWAVCLTSMASIFLPNSSTKSTS